MPLPPGWKRRHQWVICQAETKCVVFLWGAKSLPTDLAADAVYGKLYEVSEGRKRVTSMGITVRGLVLRDFDA